MEAGMYDLFSKCKTLSACPEAGKSYTSALQCVLHNTL